uniref:Sulfotransfer_1 domain-containing protein n=1 Tax=Strongyloides venezuelensis TaxID=75913 RepID=A0A0K0FSC9_STRVS
MVVRNPIERFTSDFVHLCYKSIRRHQIKFCLGYRGNFKCFVNKLYNILTSEYNLSIDAYHPTKVHFYPQTMQCSYFKNIDKFVVLKFDQKKLDTFNKSSEYIFIQQNVPPEKVEYINKEIRTHRISHSTTGKAKTNKFIGKLFKEKDVIKRLIDIYYNDFKEFNFQIPNI